MSIYYDYWYRKAGVRLPAQLISPPLVPTIDLELPRQSILHFVTTSPIDYGPAATELLFRNIQRPIMMEHVTENGDNLGSPRRIGISPDTLVRSYHLKYRRYKLSRSIEASTKYPNTMYVVN